MTDKRIKYRFWLKFDRYGTTPKATKNPPYLEGFERGMQCTVELPLSIFTRPQLTANISVSHDPDKPIKIDIEAAEAALSGVVGCDVMMDVIYPDGEAE